MPVSMFFVPFRIEHHKTKSEFKKGKLICLLYHSSNGTHVKKKQMILIVISKNTFKTQVQSYQSK